jgi:hypothetical protein
MLLSFHAHGIFVSSGLLSIKSDTYGCRKIITYYKERYLGDYFPETMVKGVKNPGNKSVKNWPVDKGNAILKTGAV